MRKQTSVTIILFGVIKIKTSMKSLIYTSLIVLCCSFYSSNYNSYNTILSKIKTTRTTLSSKKLNTKLLKQSSDTLSHFLIDKIIPFWYGTPWDFNGISNVPKQGEIACGYFVSTTLKHAGFNLNRYRLAQLGALDIIKTLTPNEKPIYIRNKSTKILDAYITTYLEEGLYVIGLDYHVGFILKNKTGNYFIHSDYINPDTGVKKEPITKSIALKDSDLFVIGSITNNDILIKKWLNQDKLI